MPRERYSLHLGSTQVPHTRSTMAVALLNLSLNPIGTAFLLFFHFLYGTTLHFCVERPLDYHITIIINCLYTQE